MPQKIDESQVRKVAQLSRLELSDEEVTQFSGQFSAILEYIEKLNELNTDGVEPLAHCVPMHNVLRQDIPEPSLSNEQALANAPDREGEFFKVPKILEEQSGL
ncbi:MAG: Asp-tRNA(Asn)/Glu-tRNA(Gln) amidotransferase subunit GatC [Planctomycetaceae bacterium]|nr:Asp-tRNA(Asn)/Glu-tRNA(Gln) amidotransferase subunit GatC [Planctomycetaceae bacterium]